MLMSWREFLLRLDGYLRHQKEEWKLARFVAYQVYISTPMKGKPVTIDKYLPLDNKKQARITDQMKEMIRLEHEKIKSKWQMS